MLQSFAFESMAAVSVCLHSAEFVGLVSKELEEANDIMLDMIRLVEQLVEDDSLFFDGGDR